MKKAINNQRAEYSNRSFHIVKLVRPLILSLLLILGATASNAQSNNYYKDEKGSMRIIYAGKNGNSHLFKLVVQNNEEQPTRIRILNEAGEEVFFEQYKGKLIEKTFQAEKEHQSLRFGISVADGKNQQWFTVQMHQKIIDAIGIAYVN